MGGHPRMLKICSTLMNLLYYSSVLSHLELLTQVLKNASLWNVHSVLSSRETALNLGNWCEALDKKVRLLRNRAPQQGQQWEKVFGSLFWVIGWLYSQDVESLVEKKLTAWQLGVSTLPKYTCLFRCLLSPGLPSPTLWQAGHNTAAQHFFSRWILTQKNQPCPEGLEVEALGSEWPKGIRIRSFRLLKVS